MESRTRRALALARSCALLLAGAAGAQVQNPANGHFYEVVFAPGGVPWTTARAQAEAQSFLGVQGHLVTMSNAAENDWVYADLLGQPLDRFWIGAFQDMTAPGYSEPLGGWAWVDGTPWSYANWFPGEPNDFGGTEHYAAFDHLSAMWNDIHDAWSLNAGYVIEYDVEDEPGTPYCFGDGAGTPCPCINEGGPGEGCRNSSGSGATLAGSGSASAAADDLVLEATTLLPNQPALLFAALNAVNGGDGSPFGDGLRCAGGGLARLGVKLPDGAGAASFGPGLGASGGWSSGDTRRFQVWYRDPVGGPCGFSFNLSNGYEVVFED